MGLPALLSQLDDEVAEGAMALGAPEQQQPPIESIAEATKMAERILSNGRATLAEIFKEIEQTAKTVGAEGAENPIERAIDRVSANEARLASQLRPLIAVAKDLQARSFGAQALKREEKARHVVVLDRFIRLAGEVLRLFRDERWRMLTLRAEIEPSGDAPIFDDPEALLDYLEATK